MHCLLLPTVELRARIAFDIKLVCKCQSLAAQFWQQWCLPSEDPSLSGGLSNRRCFMRWQEQRPTHIFPQHTFSGGISIQTQLDFVVVGWLLHQQDHTLHSEFVGLVSVNSSRMQVGSVLVISVKIVLPVIIRLSVGINVVSLRQQNRYNYKFHLCIH